MEDQTCLCRTETQGLERLCRRRIPCVSREHLEAKGGASRPFTHIEADLPKGSREGMEPMSQTFGSDYQDVERIMSRAETIGLDPRRVAQALHYAPRPAEYQAVEEVRNQRGFGLRSLARRFGRPSDRRA